MTDASDEADDLLIGAVGFYDWEQVELWANSLRRSGFTGKRMLLVYAASRAFLERAAAEGFALVTFARDAQGNAIYLKPNPSIVVERFHDMWKLDRTPAFKSQGFTDSRYVIVTDVRDVVFQTNPSAWLTTHAKRQIIVGSEAIHYRDETWGRENMTQAYGADVFDAMKDRLVSNAGTFAGRWDLLKDLFLQIYLMSRFNPVKNPDQAAFNILLHSAPYKDIVQFNTLAEAWCANIGAGADPAKPHYAPLLAEPDAIHIDRDAGVVKNAQGKTFCLLHQYDRNPAMAEMVNAKYR